MNDLAPLSIAVVGHTNVGKTSLLRTLTRQRHFGEVADRPGVTRHAERIDLLLQGEVAARFFDTPGLEDSIALLEELRALPVPGRSHPSPADRVRAFLQGPLAGARFEQEAKVLRTLLEQADAALLVIDARAPALPKYRAEMELLASCARPVMPVLNFVSAPGSRRTEWHAALREAGLHALAEFDAVAPFTGAEQALYRDLATLLPARRAQMDAIASGLLMEAAARDRQTRMEIASALISAAALRRRISAAQYADSAQRQSCEAALQADCARIAHEAARRLLERHAFAPEDALPAHLPLLAQRWQDDLFHPAFLQETGRRLGLGTALGMSLGAIADTTLAGLSLGTATTLGGAIGSALSGGWQPLISKAGSRLQGKRELTVDDAVLLTLAAQLIALNQALIARGHAASQPLAAQSLPTPALPEPQARALIRALRPARIHPEWEAAPDMDNYDFDRHRLQEKVANLLLKND
ncbi:MAG: GTPase/DUF3482 domain-containing protein [Ottowia sp.]